MSRKEYQLLRATNPSQYQNISVVRTNSMKYSRRVISPHLVNEYACAYALGVGGIIYTITDAEQLGDWMKACLESHPLFEATRI